jgi:hypothetical protein
MGVRSRAVASPKGTKGSPSDTLVVKASGAASAKPVTASPTAVTTSGPQRGRAPSPPPVRTMRTASTTPRIALSQKIIRQSETASTAAPSSGPSTDPSSCTAPTTPSGMPRRSAGHRSATIASVAGTNPPPPTPWTTRPATSVGRSVARAVTAEPTTKIARHQSRTRWRELRSAIRPMSGRTAT